MGWDKSEELTEEEAERQREWIEEMNRACEEALNKPLSEPEPHREGIDWIRTADGDVRHIAWRQQRAKLFFNRGLRLGGGQVHGPSPGGIGVKLRIYGGYRQVAIRAGERGPRLLDVRQDG